MGLKLSSANNKIKGKGLLVLHFQFGGVSISISEKEKKDFVVANSFFLPLPKESVSELGNVNPERFVDIEERLRSELKRKKINVKKYDIGLIINNYSKKQKLVNENLSDKNIIYYISDPSNGVFNQTNPTLETHYFDYYKIADNEIIAYATPKEDLDDLIKFIEELGSSVKLITPIEEAIIDLSKNENHGLLIVDVKNNNKATIYSITKDKLITDKQDIDLVSNIVEDDDMLLLDLGDEASNDLTEIEKKIKSSIENIISLHDAEKVIITGNITKDSIKKINDETHTILISTYSNKEEQNCSLTDAVSLRKVENGKY